MDREARIVKRGVAVTVNGAVGTKVEDLYVLVLINTYINLSIANCPEI